MGTDTTKLVAAGEAPEDHPVVYRDMAGQRYAIGHDDMASQPAVMRHMRVGHQKIVITQLGQPLVLRWSAVNGYALTYGVPVAYLQAGVLASIFLVLGSLSYGRKLEDVIVASDGGWPADDNMWVDTGT